MDYILPPISSSHFFFNYSNSPECVFTVKKLSIPFSGGGKGLVRMKEMGVINSRKEQKNQGMHKNEDRQGCRGVVMVATRGEMNLNISSSYTVTEESSYMVQFVGVCNSTSLEWGSTEDY